MILRDMPIWLGHCPGFHEFLEGAVLVPVPLHRRKLKKHAGLIRVFGLPKL